MLTIIYLVVDASKTLEIYFACSLRKLVILKQKFKKLQHLLLLLALKNNIF